MSAEESVFFREACLPLCENLDLGTALHRCQQALGRHMPADTLAIHVMEPELKSSRTILQTGFGVGGHERRNLITHMASETRRQLKRSPLPDLRIINRPELDPVSPPFIDLHGEDWSCLAMFLRRDAKRFAVVTLGAVGKDRYTGEHLALFSLLHEPFTLAVTNFLHRQEVVKLKDMLDEGSHFPSREPKAEDVVGHDSGLRAVMEMVRHVANLDSPVLLLGETGVGKELVANAIHYSSPRANGPFIKVNCGGIPETLVDSDLFGHERGAFTGAIAQRRGRFERADHGTILLDEIGELRTDSQVRLLRVLQYQEIERVGGTRSIKVDTRVIAATHRNLEGMVSTGAFREDLWFRINVFPIMIPPLRARRTDIPALVDHFIARKTQELKLHTPPPLARGAIDRLMAYHWPGNVRELENVVERALILSRGEPLTFRELEATWRLRQPPEPVAPAEAEHLALDEVVSAHIRRVLDLTKGRVSGPGGAAELLGVHPNTLRNRMTKLGVPYGRQSGRRPGKGGV